LEWGWSLLEFPPPGITTGNISPNGKVIPNERCDEISIRGEADVPVGTCFLQQCLRVANVQDEELVIMVAVSGDKNRDPISSRRENSKG